MNDLTRSLKIRAEGSGSGLPEELFHLLAAACSACCQECCSGNGSCPPPKLQAEAAWTGS